MGPPAGFDCACHSQLNPTLLPLPMSSLPFMRQRVPDELLSMNWTSLSCPSVITVMARLICPESLYFTAWLAVGAAMAAANARVNVFLFMLDPLFRQIIETIPGRVASALPRARMFIEVNLLAG
jgi:hypothetical protein